MASRSRPGVAASLGEIVTKAREVDALVAEIAQASNEQTQGIGQVNTAVSQMDKVTQANAAAAEESASAAEELNAQASMLTGAVQDLLSLVGGAAERPVPPTGASHPREAVAKQSAGTNGRTPAPVVAASHPRRKAAAPVRGSVSTEFKADAHAEFFN